VSDKYYEREDPHARKQRKLKQRILYFFATVGVLSIVGGTLYLTFGRHLIKKQKIDAFDKRLEKHKEKRTEAQSKTIGAVGTKFLNGKTLEEFIQCVRPLDGVEERIKKYLAANREKVNSWQFKQFNNTANLQGDVFFVGFEGENFPRNILPLEISKEGWRVDWDAFVISQLMRP